MKPSPQMVLSETRPSPRLRRPRFSSSSPRCFSLGGSGLQPTYLAKQQKESVLSSDGSVGPGAHPPRPRLGQVPTPNPGSRVAPTGQALVMDGSTWGGKAAGSPTQPVSLLSPFRTRSARWGEAGAGPQQLRPLPLRARRWEHRTRPGVAGESDGLTPKSRGP